MLALPAARRCPGRPGERDITRAVDDDGREMVPALLATSVEAARSGRSTDLRGIFHELATICGHVGPDLFAGPIQLFHDWHDNNGPATGRG